MTKQGKYNLLGIVALPVAACVGAALGDANGVWNPYGGTYRFLFGLNLGFMLFVGLLSGLLLLWSGGEKSRWLAVAPTLVTAAYGAIWYIGRGIVPAKVAPGAEYIGAPQYLLIAALAVLFIVLVLRVTGIVRRTA